MPILLRQSQEAALSRHRSVRRQFLAAVAVILLTLLLAAAGIMFLEDDRASVDARVAKGLWNAVNALSTAGDFGDLDGRQKVWVGVVLVVGGAAMLFATGTLTSLLVSGAPWQARQQRRMERRMKNLEGHAIVCGYGGAGQAVVARLAARGLQVVVVERDPEAARRASDAGHLVVQGDASEEKTLLDAGLARAAAVAILLGAHPEKLAVALMARNIAPDAMTISTASSPTGRDWLKTAGASSVVMAQELIADEFERQVTSRLGT